MIELKATNPVDDRGVPEMLVGAPPQWGDGLDSTYATVRIATGGGGFWQPQAQMPAVPLSSINSVDVRIRARIDPAYNGGGWLAFSIYDAAGFFVTARGDMPGAFSTTVGEATIPIVPVGTLADFIDTLTGGAVIQLLPNTAGYGTYTETRIDVYEVTFLIDRGANFPAPWLRQYPRSPLRHWPPERSYQRSNRKAGGYL